MYGGGVVSICMARTEEGLRNGEGFFIGVQGEDGRRSGGQEGSLDPEKKDETDSLSSEWWDVRGELCRESEEGSKTASSGPLEWRADSGKEEVSSYSRSMLWRGVSCGRIDGGREMDSFERALECLARNPWKSSIAVYSIG